MPDKGIKTSSNKIKLFLLIIYISSFFNVKHPLSILYTKEKN